MEVLEESWNRGRVGPGCDDVMVVFPKVWAMTHLEGLGLKKIMKTHGYTHL